MSPAFRSLAEILRSAHAPREPDPSAVAPTASPPYESAEAMVVTVPPAAPEHVLEACTSLALARLAVREAYERAARRALEAFASEVLSRELALSNVDIDALVQRSLQQFAADEPVAVLLSQYDAPLVSCDIPIRLDETLVPGDLVIVVRDGVVDLRLALRAKSALDETGL